MKNSKKFLAMAILIICGLQITAQSSSGTIKGQIINTDGEPIYGATIKITQGDVLIGGITTDENGKYSYKPLNPGFYEVLAQSMEFQSKRVSKVEVITDKTSYVDMKVLINTTSTIIVEDTYTKPLIDVSYINMKTINAEDLSRMAIDRGNIKDAIVSISSEVSQSSEGDLHVRGSRGEATAIIVDGVRTTNVTGIPALSIDNLSIITGGTPAQYGDATSGAIIINSMDYFSGIRNKHIKEAARNEKLLRLKREKEIKEEEIKRKKEIEMEILIENE